MNPTTVNLPLVSVLIPTYQGERFLSETLEAIASQTWGNLEIVISDDNSTDSTLAIIEAFRTRNSLPLTLLQNPQQGMVNNWNHCIANARGEYLKFVFQDDLIVPECITRMMEMAQENPALGLIYSTRALLMSGNAEDNQRCQEIFDGCQSLHAHWSILRPVMAGQEYLDDPGFFTAPTNKIGEPSAVLIKTTTITRVGGFDPRMIHLMDFEMWLRLMAHCDVGFIDAPLAVFRIHPDQQSIRNIESGKINNDLIYICKKILTDEIYAHLPLAFKARSYEVLAIFLNQYQHESQHYMDQRNTMMAQTQEMQTELEHHAGVITAQAASLETLAISLGNMTNSLTKVSNELHRVQYHLEVETATVNALRSDLNMIYNSRSWRLTKPLRKLTNMRYFLRTEGFWNVLRRVHYKYLRPKPVMPHSHSAAPMPEGFHALTFPEINQPLVSIVIPVYNKYEYTFNCLKSVLANTSDVSYEVIVVDDCSTDETPVLLKTMENITAIRNPHNSGFIHSCNTGAQAARGQYLLMLNNDTEPQPGWLMAMLDTFRDFPGAGMVGAKLLFADGTLQEAGGIVWQDASAWNYGRQQDANKPEYSYAREVDYCSGACLLLPTSDYMALGMFDTLYTPAYYEDTDLAFKVRASGKQVIYQPLARVIHFEGVSNGTDLSGGIKEYQRVNHSKFRAKWDSVLATHSPNGYLPELERERSVRKRVLIIDAQVLMPDRDSGSLRMFNFIKVFLGLGYKVTFMPDNLQYHERYTPMLQAIGVECQYCPYQQTIVGHLENTGRLYDVVVLSRADYAEKNIDAVLKYCPQAYVLFDTVDLHFLRESRAAALSGDTALQEAADMRKLQELGIARKAHLTLVVSPVEVELFRQEAPDVKVALISNIHAVAGCKADYAAREHILFIGSFDHPPNIDAMHFFIDEIFPLLHARNPVLKVLIVGVNAPNALLAKASDHIEFTGFVSDIEPLFTRVRLSIAPLRYGAGVKGKINSSMSYGVPVVATTVAAEGMGLEDGVDVLIADAPEAFAEAILRVYDDASLWQMLSDASLANINRCFSFDVAAAQLSAVLANHHPARE